jgi:quinol monooxygenase YgiN
VSAVQLSARIVARASARRELLQALQEWAVSVRREPGIVAASVYEDIDAPSVFGVVAGWQSETALDAHLRSGAFGFLLGAVDVLTQTAQVSVTRAMDEYPTDALPAIRRLRHDAAEGDGSRTS